MRINDNGIYRDATAEEIAQMQSQQNTPEAISAQIDSLKAQLSESDYICAKIAEGSATIEQYADKIAERRQIREQINALETLQTTP